MAVDTRDKRMSLIGLALPVPRVLPNPDNSITAPDRAMLLFLYYMTLAAPVIPVVIPTPDNRTYFVPTEDRGYIVPLDDRTLIA